MDNLESFYEYQSGKANIYIKGRLKSSINFWQIIGVSDFTLNVIKDGYKIPLLHQPQGIVLYNNKSAFDNHVFFDQAIIYLLRGGLIKQTPRGIVCKTLFSKVPITEKNPSCFRINMAALSELLEIEV